MAEKDRKSTSSKAKPDEPLDLVLRIIKADLAKNFEKGFGKMDPYATASLFNREGGENKLAHTKTDWNAHMNPVWNHICPNQPYSKESGANLEFKVFEDDVVGTDDLCGSIIIPVDELVGRDGVAALGKIKEFPLRMDGEVTGAIFIQASLVPHRDRAGSPRLEALSKVDADRFESPIHRIGVSGGTAPFFALVLKQPTERQSQRYFIGKDLSHATDEIQFYEQMKRLANQTGGLSLIPVLNFCFEYEGVVTLPVADAKPDEKPKDLLVLRNLFDGAKSLRLLDIKIGQKTADAGWQGKSRLAALRQSVVDGLTNSAAEGFRLEGFDGLTPVLKSMDPLLDFGGAKKEKTAKKAFRFLLQRMAGHEMLMHLLDVHQIPEDLEAEIKSRLSPEELAELVLSEMVVQLIKLAVSCRLIPVPQKWIGSSVALGFDAGELPLRSTKEEKLRRDIKVSIFDWGRSELLTIEAHAQLPPKLKKDRSQFWGYYVGGIDRLAFEASRLYWQRFSNTTGWKEIRLKVFDFDSATPNDFIGKCTIPKLTPEKRKILKLLNNKNQVVKEGAKETTFTYTLSKREYPVGSRLKHAWRVTLHCANNLPRYDKILMKSTVDAFVEVVVVAENGRTYKQVTSVKSNTLTPTWDETIEFPIAANSDVLEESMNKISPELLDSALPLGSLFIPDEGVEKQEKKKRYGLFSSKSNLPVEITTDSQAMNEFEQRLDNAATTYEASVNGDTDISSSMTGWQSSGNMDSMTSSQKLGSQAVKALRDHRTLMRTATPELGLPQGCMRAIERKEMERSFSDQAEFQDLIAKVDAVPEEPEKTPEPEAAIPEVVEENKEGLVNSMEEVPVDQLAAKKAGDCDNSCQCKCM